MIIVHRVTDPNNVVGIGECVSHRARFSYLCRHLLRFIRISLVELQFVKISDVNFLNRCSPRQRLATRFLAELQSGMYN